MNSRNSFFDSRNNGYAEKRHLVRFAKRFPEFNKQAYGEIMFDKPGKKETYSPYVTVSANIDPSTIWELFTSFWKLPVPHIILSTVGNFCQVDKHWKDINKTSWIFTKGSSPPSRYKKEAWIIGLQKAASFEGWQSLYARNEEGLFPVRYTHIPTEDGDALDSQHTHFVFVEGTDDEVAKFRHTLLDYLSSKPIKFDSTSSKYIEIPIVCKMTSDSVEEILFAARCALSNHIVVIHENAKQAVSLLNQMHGNKRGQSKTEKNVDEMEKLTIPSLKDFLRQFKTEEDKISVQTFFVHSNEYDLTIYFTSTSNSLEEAIINAVISWGDARLQCLFLQCNAQASCSKLLQRWLTDSSIEPESPVPNDGTARPFADRYCPQTGIKLALLCNRVDLITQYFTTKDIPNNQLLLLPLLHLAITLDRGLFLELLVDNGFNVYQSLTTRMLWNLYYKEIEKKNPYSNSSSLVLTHHLKNKRNFDPQNLMFEIGLLISQLSNYELDNIYDDPLYALEGRPVYQEGVSSTRNLVDDKSPLVPHPVRDLFIWCLFTEHNELAKVLWKHGSEYLAHSLLASVIYTTQAEYLDKETDISLPIENLQTCATEWQDASIDYLQKSSNMMEQTTQAQLTAILPHLGNCSCINLAHGGNLYRFMSEKQIQSILGVVWVGASRSDMSLIMILLTILFPFIIPFTNVTRSEPTFSIFNNQIYSPFFSDHPSEHEEANLRNVIHLTPKNINRQQSTIAKFSFKAWLKQSCKKIQAFYHSPRIIFISDTLFHVASIFLLSAVLVAMNIYRFRNIYKINLYWLAWFMLGLLVEDMREILVTRATGIHNKFRIWLSNSWHVSQLGMNVCYFSGLSIFIWTNDKNWWYASKVLFSLALILLYIRALRSYTVSKVLGPILHVIKGMFQDFIAFVSITGLLFWAYGIILHSLESEQMPQSDVNPTLRVWGDTFGDAILGVSNYVIRQPFWQLFGDLYGNATALNTNFVDIILSTTTGIYVFFTTILMLNLLIAMLSYTYEQTRENSYAVWAFIRYETIETFTKKPCLASPFILFIHVMRLVKYLVGKSIPVKTTAFKRILTDQELKFTREFEVEVMDELFKKEPEKESVEIMLKKNEKFQEAITMQVEMLLNEVRKKK